MNLVKSQMPISQNAILKRFFISFRHTNVVNVRAVVSDYASRGNRLFVKPFYGKGMVDSWWWSDDSQKDPVIWSGAAVKT